MTESRYLATTTQLHWIQATTEETTADVAAEKLLIEKAKRDDSALAALYRHYYPVIAAYVRARVRDTHQADDVIGEVFLEMVKHLPRYQCRGIPFRIWLFRIATSRLSRWARKRRRWAWRQLNVEELSLSGADGKDSADAEMIDLVLATLPNRLQTVLTLYYLEEMKIAEIADVVRCPEGTVKSRLHDGRTLMRERLEKRRILHEK